MKTYRLKKPDGSTETPPAETPPEPKTEKRESKPAETKPQSGHFLERRVNFRRQERDG